MGKKNNVIEINGKRYDAHTGAALNHGHGHQPVKQITIQPAPKPSVGSKHHRTGRQPAKHAAHHKQQRSTTLMRRTVSKPGVSLKHRLKVQSNTGALVEQPSSEVVPKLSFGAPDAKRLQRANHIRKSHLITHFNPRQPDYKPSGTAFAVPVTVKPPAAKAAAPSKTTQNPSPRPASRQPAPNIDDIFDRAVQNATSHLEPAPKKAKRRRLHLTRKHVQA